jgi:putative spermidine/putrescine transport system ATP-binding protein
MSGAPAIRLTGLTKSFGSVAAVDGVNLDIAPGDFFSMLGPSGSGKTTVLRMIAGFEQPTSGTVELFGKDVTADPPFDRDVNTVFQDYALFPHMSVLDNVAFGLRVRGVGAKERAATARDALSLVRLEGYGDRTPQQLSGGQRQRVALARALVVEPKVLLLDEPLGALDLKLREQMQVELKDIQRRLGITFIFVTHDQEEALTLSDRIAVFNEGNIVQLGSAEEIYRHPATPFVANFVGSSTVFTSDESKAILGTSGACSVRPEHIDIVRGKAPAGTISLTGTVFDTIFLGASTRVIVDLDAGKRVAVLEQNDMSKKETHRGDSVTLAIHPQFLSKLA